MYVKYVKISNIRLASLYAEREKMKKVINGKMYNTKTATKLFDYDWYDNGNWFCTRGIYRKKTGEYFKCTLGNGNQYMAPDDKIEPITLTEAKEFIEEWADGETYEEIFGEIEDEPDADLKQQISILLPSDIYQKLKDKKDKTGTNISTLIINALNSAGY